MAHRCWLIALCLLALPAAHADVLTLDDLYSDVGAATVAVSPSGRYLAAVVRRKDDDLLVVQDLTTGQSSGLTRVGLHDVAKQFDSRIAMVEWKTDERLLFRVSILPSEGMSWRSLTRSGYRRLGHRLFSIDRAGKGLVRLLAQNKEYELDFASNLGRIRSFLPHDPTHILMVVDGGDGRSLFKVDVVTGQGEVVEHARLSVWDWWLDLDGKPVVQVEVSGGSLRFLRRDTAGKWKKFYSIRLSELQEQDDYQAIGPSDQDGKFYVLARPEGAQRRGIYLYDLNNESFGPPLAENPQYDIFSASVARDGTRLLRYCYIAHVRVCESGDPRINSHMKGIRKYFKDSANVYVVDASDDNETLLLYVEGPSDPPAYYQYRFDASNIQLVGMVHEAMGRKAMPTASVLEYAARDGLKLTGYVTRPPGADQATNLPLVVMPHGGPEARDHLTFDPIVQLIAAQGYVVFQPNFRGSDGFGRTFAESGRGEWGRKMQDDISDGLAALVAQKLVDPRRVCIVGASYGGYAALTGAMLSPDLYRCAVSISGPGDLAEMLKVYRKRFGADSETYQYWVRQIGDPDKDAERIAAISPALHVDRISVPVLLVHGDEDPIIPFTQAQQMKKLLDKAGHKTDLVTLDGEGHGGWSEEGFRRALTAVTTFIREKIGPGAEPRRGNSP